MTFLIYSILNFHAIVLPFFNIVKPKNDVNSAVLPHKALFFLTDCLIELLTIEIDSFQNNDFYYRKPCSLSLSEDEICKFTDQDLSMINQLIIFKYLNFTNLIKKVSIPCANTYHTGTNSTINLIIELVYMRFQCGYDNLPIRKMTVKRKSLTKVNGKIIKKP